MTAVMAFTSPINDGDYLFVLLLYSPRMFVATPYIMFFQGRISACDSGH